MTPLARRAVPALALALLLAPFDLHAQNAPNAELLASVRKASEATWTRVGQMLMSGQLTGLASLWTTDGLLISGGSPTISGSANIEQNVRRQATSVKFLGYSHLTNTMEASGDLAVETGTQTATVSINGNKPVTSTSRFVVVYRRVNGAWLTRLNVESPSPAPAIPAAPPNAPRQPPSAPRSPA